MEDWKFTLSRHPMAAGTDEMAGTAVKVVKVRLGVRI